MIKRGYSGNSRRALNMIWNGAGKYDFEPLFMAYYPDGRPDPYMNLVIGLVEKWLDSGRIAALFSTFPRSKAEEWEDYLWLFLESAVYIRELPERPRLSGLRKQHAEEFFKNEQNLSRQQMMLQSMPVYRQQQARWAEVSGRKPPRLSAREREMANALIFHPIPEITGRGEEAGTDADAVLAGMEDFLARFCGRKRAGDRMPPKRPEKGLFGKLLRKIPAERRGGERLIVKTGAPGNAREAGVTLDHGEGSGGIPERAEADRMYLEACFGPPLLPEREMSALEGRLCSGKDADCRLWIADAFGASGMAGEKIRPGKPESRALAEAGEDRRARERQKQKNEAFAGKNARRAEDSIRRLSAELETLFSSYMRHSPEKAAAGRLLGAEAWKLPVLREGRIFAREGGAEECPVTVDLLLDASRSREDRQEIIANEAWILAESFSRARIPLRLWSFRSLRGHTVLERLKDYGEPARERVLSYYAGGWNRDGLALRVMDELLREDYPDPERLKILLILTDANPNDSVPLRRENGRPREYEGLPAVEDARSAVKELAADGILTAAIFHGAGSYLENARRIYGDRFVRIQDIRALADAAGTLTAGMLRERRTD